MSSDMNDLIIWFENHYDPDEVVAVLGITTEELIRAFPERAEDYQGESEEAET